MDIGDENRGLEGSAEPIFFRMPNELQGGLFRVTGFRRTATPHHT
jgi:hypothetical protein